MCSVTVDFILSVQDSFLVLHRKNTVRAIKKVPIVHYLMSPKTWNSMICRGLRRYCRFRLGMMIAYAVAYLLNTIELNICLFISFMLYNGYISD